MNKINLNKRQQRGATLVVAMIVLMVLMILGVGAVMTANTQFKMAGNLQFENLAKDRAENQVTAAENWLSQADNPAHSQFINNPGFTAYSVATKELHPSGHLASIGISDPLNMSNAQWIANSTSTALQTDGYMIEMLGADLPPPGASKVIDPKAPCNKYNLFLITSRGSSPRGATRLIQSVYQVFSC